MLKEISDVLNNRILTAVDSIQQTITHNPKSRINSYMDGISTQRYNNNKESAKKWCAYAKKLPERII